ncbi:MAG: PEGA domain-containing protein [Polyangiaceae bacterium]
MIRATAILMAGTLLATLPASGAAAQPRPAAAAASDDHAEETAQQLLQQGRKHYAARRVQKAYEAFRAAWELRQTTGIACNLGQTEMELKKFRDAAEHLDWCLAELPEPKPVEGAKDLESAKAHVVTLLLVAQPEGATIQIDGQPVGTAPTARPIFLEPGTHKLELFREGHDAHIESFDAVAGDSVKKEISLVARVSEVDAGLPPASEPADVAPAEPVRPLPESGVEAKTLVVVGGGVATLGAVAAGVLFRIDASSKADKRDRLQRDAGDCFASASTQCHELSEAQSDYESLANTSTLFFGLGAGLAVLTVGTYLLWPDEPEPPEKARGVRHLRVGVAPRALLIQGEF